MKTYFGYALLCRDINVCTDMAKKYRFNSVTVDGQYVSSRMALTGGYIDSKKSKIIAYKEWMLAKEKSGNFVEAMKGLLEDKDEYSTVNNK